MQRQFSKTSMQPKHCLTYVTNISSYRQTKTTVLPARHITSMLIIGGRRRKHVSIQSYTATAAHKEEIVKNQISMLSSFGLYIKDDDCDLPFINLLHKTPQESIIIRLYSCIGKMYDQSSFETINCHTHVCERGYSVLPRHKLLPQ